MFLSYIGIVETFKKVQFFFKEMEICLPTYMNSCVCVQPTVTVQGMY